MLFNSLHFLLFFPIVVFLYFLMVPKWRTYLLLIASYYFYMSWKPEYAILIFGSTIIDYFTAIKIHQTKSKNRKRNWLILSLGVNLGVLFFFKYFDFFFNSFHDLFVGEAVDGEATLKESLMVVGISFYTFQTLSYTIDVYRERLAPEKDFSRFALFVSFFPQLVAGPIERATHLVPQFRKDYSFDYERVVSGLRLVLWGFFKKVVIADRLALVVNQVYNFPEEQNGLTYLIATYFFAFQIYCDFSGYSDIAIGTARIMGYDLMENFRQPYLSQSIKEFWSRWHISLSTWFRDYVYIPLGGNRRVKWRWYYNLFITFLISGLWHGANWTFIVWGALHGAYLIIGINLSNWLPKVNNKVVGVLKTVVVFHLVVLAWVFFRAANVHAAFDVFYSMVQFPNALVDFLSGIPVFIGFGEYTITTIFYLVLLVVGLFLTDWLSTKSKVKTLYHNHSALRWVTYFVLLYGIVFGGYFGKTEFIYFQF
mgnify:FL=1